MNSESASPPQPHSEPLHDASNSRSSDDTIPSGAVARSEVPDDGLLTPEEVHNAAVTIRRLLDGLNTAILGQQALVDLVVICLLARGHLLLEGLPGLGKTELVKALAALLGLEFRRIQFTPDLLPGDIIGVPILEEHDSRRRMVFHRGPVFSNLLLADEINRATPKTQSALLEAMSEHRVTVLGETHALPHPFFVLATQNPIELEGTYPLPEAQLDRFTMKINVSGIPPEVLQEIITTRRHGRPPELEVVVNSEQWMEVTEAVERVHLPAAVAGYISRLVAASHPDAANAPDEVQRFVRFGASPRAAIALSATARAAALINERPNVSFDDVRRVAPAVLNHRILLDYSARMEGWTPPQTVSRLLEAVSELGRELPEDVTS